MTLRRWWVAFALLAAGCVSGSSTVTHPVPTPTPTPALVTPSRTAAPVATPTRARATGSPATRPVARACGAARPAGQVVLALPGGRRALFAVPPGDDGRHRLGLVLALPGYGQSSEQLAAQTRLPARAMTAGVLAVLPQGAGSPAAWNFVSAGGRDDVAFLAGLLDELEASWCVDPARVVITGMSDGGDMAAYAACGLPGRFRELMTVAASTTPRARCHRIPILALHGDADPLDPYGGGPDGRPGYPAVPPALSAIAAWAALDGCSRATDRLEGTTLRVRTYPCGAELVTVHGGGHTWPGGVPGDPAYGPTTTEYDATATVLRMALR